MADYTSPYADIPSYGKGPKSVYSPEDTVSTSGFFEVVLNVPQMDDDDEWGKTETIALRQIADRINTLVQEVEDPNATGTSGLVNQVTALRKVVLLDSNVFTSGVTDGCSLSIGSTQISETSAAFGRNISVAGNINVEGSILSKGAFTFWGAGLLCGNVQIGGNVSTQAIIVNGPLSVIDGMGGDAALSVAGPVTGGRITAGTGIFNHLVTESPGTTTFCGAVRAQKVADSTGSGTLIVDDSIETTTLTANSLTVSTGSVLNTLSVGSDEDESTALVYGELKVNTVLGTSGHFYVSGTSNLVDLNVTGISHFYSTSHFCGEVFIGVAGIPNTVTHIGSYVLSDGSATLPIIAGATAFSDPVTINSSLTVTGNLLMNNGTAAYLNTILPNTTGIYNIGSTGLGYQRIYLSDVNNLTGTPLAFYIKVSGGTTSLVVYNGSVEKTVAVT